MSAGWRREAGGLQHGGPSIPCGEFTDTEGTGPGGALYFIAVQRPRDGIPDCFFFLYLNTFFLPLNQRLFKFRVLLPTSIPGC